MAVMHPANVGDVTYDRAFASAACVPEVICARVGRRPTEHNAVGSRRLKQSTFDVREAKDLQTTIRATAMTDAPEADRSALERGFDVARQVAGDVRSPRLDKDMYKLIVQYAFGEVWSRPGLDINSRRLISLSMTLAGHHLAEFKLHTRFALANGTDRSVIKELILQSAIYCGVPAALEAFRVAEEVYKEIDGNALARSAP